MKFSLSTNWCNRRIEDGAEIAELALSLGFDELELGFHTSMFQVDGFKRMAERIPVGSVHAFCPVPISAPQGYPELYTLASFDADARAIARFHVAKNIRFAAEIGADTVVLHAGRVGFGTFFRRGFSSRDIRKALEKAEKKVDAPRYAKMLAKARKRREENGRKMLEVFRGEIAALVPELEKCGVVLALENLPYLEGFPNEDEMSAIAGEFAGAPVMAWFDTGHHRVRECCGWLSESAEGKPPPKDIVRGMHLNDVTDINDDHFAPGDGKVDFAALKVMMHSVRHVVFEPHSHVSQESLAKGLELIKSLAAKA